jgi:hypothetical protein
VEAHQAYRATNPGEPVDVYKSGEDFLYDTLGLARPDSSEPHG